MTDIRESLQLHKFQVGEENIIHRRFGRCHIVAVENWKGYIFYTIRQIGSKVEFKVTEATLSKELVQ